MKKKNKTKHLEGKKRIENPVFVSSVGASNNGRIARDSVSQKITKDSSRRKMLDQEHETQSQPSRFLIEFENKNSILSIHIAYVFM